MVEQLAQRIVELAALFRSLEIQKESLLRELKEWEAQEQAAEQAMRLLHQARSRFLRHRLSQFESLVNPLLEEKFGYTLSLEYDYKRGRSEASLHLIKEGVGEVELANVGGGVLDIISILLKIGSMATSHAQPILVLDEPFKYVNAALIPELAEFLSRLSHQLEFQIIAVSHTDFPGDCVWQLGCDGPREVLS